MDDRTRGWTDAAERRVLDAWRAAAARLRRLLERLLERPPAQSGRHAPAAASGPWWRRLATDRDAAVSAALVAAAVAAVLAHTAGLPTPLRAVLTLGFLLLCPGLAVVRLFPIPSRVVVATLAVALSLVLDQATAMAAMYAGVWTPAGCLVALAVLTSTAATLPYLRVVVARGGGRHVLAPR